jgi:hypothetical protein
LKQDKKYVQELRRLFSKRVRVRYLESEMIDKEGAKSAKIIHQEIRQIEKVHAPG